MKIKVKKGKGILCKDNRTPYAPRTMHAVREGWMIPLPYKMENLLAALLDPKIERIEFIDEDNNEFVVDIGRG